MKQFPSVDKALNWIRHARVEGYSLQSILEVTGKQTGYPKIEDPGWGQPHELIPAPKWIAAQRDLVGRDGKQRICGAIRYFNYVAQCLSGETLAVSIIPHFNHLTFNPYPLALWIQAVAQSLSGMPLIGDQAGRTSRTNDCFLHLELRKSEAHVVGTLQEGFVALSPEAYPLTPSGRIGTGMPGILSLAALCGIKTIQFHTRIGDGPIQTRSIDTSDQSVSAKIISPDLMLGENEILLNFEFDIGDQK